MIETIVKWLLMLVINGITSVMDFFIGLFSNMFGADTTMFLHTFPIIKDFQSSFVQIGFSLCFLFIILALFRNLFSGLGFTGEKPLKMILRFFIAIFLVVYSATFMEFIFEHTFKDMYNNVYNVSGGIANAGETLKKFNEDNSFTASAIENVTQNSVVIQLLIALIFIILISLNLFKLLIEMVERYLMVNVLIFFAPIVGAAVTLESTMRVFQTYCKMFFGQLMLLILNVVSLRMVGSGLAQLSKDLSFIPVGQSPEAIRNNHMYIFADVLLIVAFLKIAQRFDSYLRDLGITVGITGGNLTDEILTAGKTVTHTVGRFFGGKGGKGGGDATSTSGIFGKIGKGAVIGGSVGAGVAAGAQAIKYVANKFKQARGMIKIGGEMEGASIGEAFRASVNDDLQNTRANVPGIFMPKQVAGSIGRNIAMGKANVEQPMTGMQAKKAIKSNFNLSDKIVDAKVGNGAYMYQGKHGQMYRISYDKPQYGDYETIKDSQGNVAYRQNLSALNLNYQAETGEDHFVFTQAREQYTSNATDFHIVPPESKTTPKPESMGRTQPEQTQGESFRKRYYVKPEQGKQQ